MDFAHPLGLSGELGSGPGDKRERKAERLSADFGAGLRQRGTPAVAIKILDLSTNGFRASTDLELVPGTEVWLRLSGLEPWPSKVVWMDGPMIGCEFARPLHPAVLANIIKNGH